MRPIPTLPYGMTREQAVDALRDLRNLATAAQQDADPGFKRWPVLDELIDHIVNHGLPPLPHADFVERYVIEQDGKMRVEMNLQNTPEATP